MLTTPLLRPSARACLLTLCAAALVVALSMITTTGQAPAGTPTVRLATAPRHAMPGAIDSNPPVIVIVGCVSLGISQMRPEKESAKM